MNEIEFTILGEPVGKGRPKFSTSNGFAMAYTPKKTVNFETLVKLSFQQQCSSVKPYDKDIMLGAQIVAFFPIPKSVSKKKRQEMLDGRIRPTKKPDNDNIAKAVLDALNGIAYYDDSQICDLSVYKYYSDEPKTVVRIKESI